MTNDASDPRAGRRAILLVDHGSRRSEANDMLRDVAALVARAAPAWHVEIAHMELASPSIADGIAACVAAGAREVVVHPYMLAPGRHAAGDIPRLAEEAARAHDGLTVRVTSPLGVDERIAQVILTRVRESAPGAESEENTRP